MTRQCFADLHLIILQVETKVDPSQKKDSGIVDKTAKRIFFVDQLALFSVPVVYVLAVAVFMAIWA